MNDIDHLTVDRGDIVEPRHLALVVSNDWPDESDTDQHYDEPERGFLRQPVRQQVDLRSAVVLVSLGAFIATVLWFQFGGA